MNNLKVLLVTGGAAGIGRGIAKLFANRQYAVVIADKDRLGGEALAGELAGQGHHATFLEVDIRDETSVKELMRDLERKFARLDCLCNNAGIEFYRSAEEYSLEDYQAITDTNLRGTFLCTKYAFPLLKASAGSVITISSVQAFASERNISIYAGTKAALLGWTRAAALDFAPHGIRVNAVCPGATHTAMTDAMLAQSPEPAKMLGEMTRSIPLQRMGRPEDIAEVVYFLASPAAAYITGASVVVDGGLLAKLAI